MVHSNAIKNEFDQAWGHTLVIPGQDLKAEESGIQAQPELHGKTISPNKQVSNNKTNNQ